MRNLWREDSGQDLGEYALIVALVWLLSLAAMGAFGVTLSGAFKTANAALSGAFKTAGTALSDAFSKVGNATR
jgi:Flp pilus assembly pilin Flp